MATSQPGCVQSSAMPHSNAARIKQGAMVYPRVCDSSIGRDAVTSASPPPAWQHTCIKCSLECSPHMVVGEGSEMRQQATTREVWCPAGQIRASCHVLQHIATNGIDTMYAEGRGKLQCSNITQHLLVDLKRPRCLSPDTLSRHRMNRAVRSAAWSGPIRLICWLVWCDLAE
jgi:hypothetical protein